MRGRRRSSQPTNMDEMDAAFDSAMNASRLIDPDDMPAAATASEETEEVDDNAPIPVMNGTVRRVMFPQGRTEFIEPQFVIMSVFIRELKRNIIVKGTMPFLPSESDTLEIVGTVVQKPTRNNPSVMEDVIENAYISQKIEFTEDSIRGWLAKNISSVGPATANRIIRTLGGARAINKFGDRQAMIDAGIDEAIASDIALQYSTNQSAIKEFMFLSGLKGGGHKSILHSNQIKAIQEHFKGKGTVPAIKANPWVLASISGISFETADKIGINDLGFSTESSQRIYAGTVYALEWIGSEQGHTGAPENLLVQKASSEKILNIDPSLISNMLIEMADEGIIVRDIFEGVGEEGEGRDPEIHYTNTGLIFSRAMWDAENLIADRIVKILSKPPFMSREEAEKAMEKAARIVDMRTLDDSQKDAIIKGIMYPALTITGGPGTGKSTVQKILFTAINLPECREPRERQMSNLIESWRNDDEGPSYSLISAACPTGKGAVRLAEASGETATTVHRQLGARKNGGFSFNANNPLPASVIGTDEFSMMDTDITAKQLSAISDSASVILIGDDDQLTSVGPGQVLRDIIDSGIMPVAKLGRTHRQAKVSGIPVVASRILSGVYPFQENEELRGCTHINVSDDMALDKVMELVSNDIVRQGLSPDTDIIVMSPMRNGSIGVIRCNAAIKNSINPVTPDKRTHEFSLPDSGRGGGGKLANGGKDLTIDDVVMNLENNAQIGVANGEIGTVSGFTDVPELDKEGNPTGTMLTTPVIDFGSGDVVFPPDKLHKLAVSNVNTVHKNQGSENTIAVIMLPSHAAHMTSKNLVFTGLTRGKVGAYIIGTADSLMKAVNNISATNRFTGLKQKLIARRPELIRKLEAINGDISYFEDNLALIRAREETARQVKAKAEIAAKAPTWAIRETKRRVRNYNNAARPGPPVNRPGPPINRPGGIRAVTPVAPGRIVSRPGAAAMAPPPVSPRIQPSPGQVRPGMPGRTQPVSQRAPGTDRANPQQNQAASRTQMAPQQAPRSAPNPAQANRPPPIAQRSVAPPPLNAQRQAPAGPMRVMRPQQNTPPIAQRAPAPVRHVPARPVISSRPTGPAESKPTEPVEQPSTPAGITRPPEPPPPPTADSKMDKPASPTPGNVPVKAPIARRVVPPPRTLIPKVRSPGSGGPKM